MPCVFGELGRVLAPSILQFLISPPPDQGEHNVFIALGSGKHQWGIAMHILSIHISTTF